MVVQKMIEDAIKGYIYKTGVSPRTLVISDTIVSALKREIHGVDYVISCMENDTELEIKEYRGMKVVPLWQPVDPMTLLVG